MSSGLRSDASTLLAEANQPDWKLLVNLLQVAFQYWPVIISPTSINDVDALECLLALNNALQQITTTLGSSLPQLFDYAPVGTTLKDELARKQEALSSARLALDRLTAEIQPLLDQEGTLQALIEQKSELEDRLAELQRLDNLGKHTVNLQSQVNTLEQHLSANALEADALEHHLREATDRLVILDQEQLELLRDKLRHKLNLTETLEVDLSQTVLALREAEARYQAVEQVLTPEHRETLRLYLQADEIVFQALHRRPEAKGVQEMLDETKSLLGRIDDCLRLALQANEKVSHLKPLSVRGNEE